MKELKVYLTLSDEEKYLQFQQQVENLIDDDCLIISNLANFIGALKQTFEKISWVGFYLLKDNRLHLGPFQGKIACTLIEMGKGVCGSAAAKKETVIVENVNLFPGHITCDADSKSEIVVPLIKDNKLFGVLDIDSTSFSSFNENDKFHLENLCRLLLEKINIDNFVVN